MIEIVVGIILVVIIVYTYFQYQSYKKDGERYDVNIQKCLDFIPQMTDVDRILIIQPDDRTAHQVDADLAKAQLIEAIGQNHIQIFWTCSIGQITEAVAIRITHQDVRWSFIERKISFTLDVLDQSSAEGFLQRWRGWNGIKEK